MKLSVAPYKLTKKNHRAVNTHDTAFFQEGALLRFQQGEDWGVADICPRLELGDADWQAQIADRGMLFLRAMELALEDMLARKNGQSLLSYETVKNNYLITDYRAENLNQSSYADQTVKIKADRDVKALAKILNEIRIPLQVRLDFNSCLSAELFESFLAQLEPSARACIEYIEDPTLMSAKWKEWNATVPLAFDFQNAEYDPTSAQFRIIKPTRQRLPDNMERVTLTSAMDHPIGIAHGLRLAQKHARSVAGFLTLSLYEETPFHRYFVQSENTLAFTEEVLKESGIGMTAELAQLKWSEI